MAVLHRFYCTVKYVLSDGHLNQHAGKFFINFCHLLNFFSKLAVSKYSFSNTIYLLNSLYQDLGPNFLQWFSADNDLSSQ